MVMKLGLNQLIIKHVCVCVHVLTAMHMDGRVLANIEFADKAV